MILEGVCLHSLRDQEVDDDSGYWIDPDTLKLPTDFVPVYLEFDRDVLLGAATVWSEAGLIYTDAGLDEPGLAPTLEVARKLAIGCYFKGLFIHTIRAAVLTDLSLTSRNADKGIPDYQVVTV